MSCLKSDSPINKSGVVRSPYVAIGFSKLDDNNFNPLITVGNESYPSANNSAIVSYFEFGSSNGTQLTVEITDVEGGAFTNFYDNVYKDTKDKGPSLVMRADWGWIIRESCDGPGTLESVKSLPGGCPKIPVFNIETIFGNGVIKYVVTGNDVNQPVFASRGDKVLGSEKTPMPLKQAIIELFTKVKDGGPLLPSGNVKFFRAGSGGGSEWEFKEGKEKPKGIWHLSQQNKVATAMRWISNHVTDKDKGIFPFYHAGENKMYFCEDVLPSCKSNSSVNDTFASFIVNGGPRSSVISFNPKISWLGNLALQFGRGGGGGGTVSTGTKTTEPDCQKEKLKAAGVTESVTTKTTGKTPTAKAYEDQVMAFNKNRRANTAIKAGIEAELRIIGEVSKGEFVYQSQYLNKYIELAVLNPFKFEPSGGGGCLKYLTSDACNEELSSDKWQVKGVSHSIREGSFVTTMKIWLANAENAL